MDGLASDVRISQEQWGSQSIPCNVSSRSLELDSQHSAFVLRDIHISHSCLAVVRLLKSAEECLTLMATIINR